jgi:hypothetical protein
MPGGRPPQPAEEHERVTLAASFLVVKVSTVSFVLGLERDPGSFITSRADILVSGRKGSRFRNPCHINSLRVLKEKSELQLSSQVLISLQVAHVKGIIGIRVVSCHNLFQDSDLAHVKGIIGTLMQKSGLRVTSLCYLTGYDVRLR